MRATDIGMKMAKAALAKVALAGGIALAAITAPMLAQAQSRPDQQAFFGLYKELVETNTTLSVGSCTKAAEQIGTRMKAAGYRDADITMFSVADHPREGGIVIILPGSDKKMKPMLLLGHLDVVEAKREDWVRDPFTLIEENGYYYARGILDASNRLISLINDILDIATIEAGYLQLDLGPVDVKALLSAVEVFANERARNRNLQFAIDCPDGIGTMSLCHMPKS